MHMHGKTREELLRIAARLLGQTERAYTPEELKDREEKIKRGRHLGIPPADSKFRCTADSRLTRERCKRWALRGKSVCQYHGGRTGGPKVADMPATYSRYLGPKLKQFVTDLLAKPEAACDLKEELALCRAMVDDSLKLAAPVLENPEKFDTHVRATAHSLLSDAIENVRKLVDTIAKIEAGSGEMMSARHVDAIVSQLLRITHGVLTEELGAEVGSRLAVKLTAAVDDNLRMPKQNAPMMVNIVAA